MGDEKYPALIVEVLDTNKFGNPLYADENRENRSPLDIIEEKIPEDERRKHIYRITHLSLRGDLAGKILNISEKTYNYKNGRLKKHEGEKSTHTVLYDKIKNWIG